MVNFAMKSYIVIYVSRCYVLKESLSNILWFITYGRSMKYDVEYYSPEVIFRVMYTIHFDSVRVIYDPIRSTFSP